MKDIGALPSLCSGATTTSPWLANEPVKWLYAFFVPPNPCENTMTGHRPPISGDGGSNWASCEAGIVTW